MSKNLLYKFIEQIGYQGISFVIGIVLARLLGPSVYGTLSILLVFLSFAQIFVQTGFSYSLIQKEDLNDSDISFAFLTNIGIATITYIVLFWGSRAIAIVYGDPQIVIYLRVLGLLIFPAAYDSVQIALASRKMDFRHQLWASMAAYILSGCVSILMALKGFGIWALIVQQIMIRGIHCFIMSRFVKWRISTIDDAGSVLKLWKYGWKILAAHLLDNVYQEGITLVMGWKYPREDVGYYNRGNQFPRLLTISLTSSIQAVLFPVLSRSQSDDQEHSRTVRDCVTYSTTIIFPMLGVLFAIAPSLIYCLLGSDWMSSVVFVRLMTISYFLHPIYTILTQAIMSTGQAGVALKIDAFQAIIGIIGILFIAQMKSRIFMLIVYVLIVKAVALVYAFMMYRKLSEQGIRSCLSEIFLNFVFTLAIATPVLILGGTMRPGWVLLISQFFLTLLLFPFAVYLLRRRELKTILDALKRLKGANNLEDV